MTLSREIAKLILNLNPKGFVDQEIAERQFEVIIQAFNHLNSDNKFVYIADEVGLGKTYIALGILTLLRHFNQNPQKHCDLIIVPKKNLQVKWQKEIRSFISNNYLLQDNRVKSVLGESVGACNDAQLHDSLVLIENPFPSFDLMRNSSFSMSFREKQDWEELIIPLINSGISYEKISDYFDNRFPNKEDLEDLNSFARRLYAYLLNIHTPKFDTVVVDEAHHFRHGSEIGVAQRNQVMSRFMGSVLLDEDQDIFQLLPELQSMIRPLAKHVIFLSATPINRSLIELKNQLDVFLPFHPFKDIPVNIVEAELKSELNKFLIRGVMLIKVFSKPYSRNMYRWEHRNGNVEKSEHAKKLLLNDDLTAITTGLIQFQTMRELDQKANASFEIGLLAGFESFSPKPKKEQEYENESREIIESKDLRIIETLARSYQDTFGQSMPHLKQDAIVNELFQLMTSQEKGLVFVNRIASVKEISYKLLERFTTFQIEIIKKIKGTKSAPGIIALLQDFDDRQRKEAIDDTIHRLGDRIWQAKKEIRQTRIRDSKAFARSDLVKILNFLFKPPVDEDVKIPEIPSPILEEFHNQIIAHLSRKNFSKSLLDSISVELISKVAYYLDQELDPDESEPDGNEETEEDGPSNYFFNDFFKARGLSFRKYSYSQPWYEINLVLLLINYNLFGFDTKNLATLKSIQSSKEKAKDFRQRMDEIKMNLTKEGGSDTFRNVDEEFKEDTWLTTLLLSQCRNDFDLWIANREDYSIDHFLNDLDILNEILKGILRNGSGLVPAYIAYCTKPFEEKLTKLLENDFNFVLAEIKTIISDFDRLKAINFPNSSKVKFALFNQSPVLGVSGAHKVNVSKSAIQFRMPGYPYILIATDILKEGEDLHAYCQNIYHYGIAWNPSDMEQRTGRIDRIGSKCYYGLQSCTSDVIQFNEKLQVFYPYLSDSLEVNQIAKVFRDMNNFISTFYDFTEQQELKRAVSILDQVDEIPPQIEELLKSKYDVEKFVCQSQEEGSLDLQPLLGSSFGELSDKMDLLTTNLRITHVDRTDEFVKFDPDSLKIKGMIYKEAKGRKCPFAVELINGKLPGEFFLEIVSPIGERSAFRRKDLEEIHLRLPGNTYYEHNNLILAKSIIDMDSPTQELQKKIEEVAFLADELEGLYLKGKDIADLN